MPNQLKMEDRKFQKEKKNGTSLRSDNDNHNTVAGFSKYLQCQETEGKESQTVIW